jgi:SHS family sialic acid transporter-like MFS transporter
MGQLDETVERGKWMALTAALLGWLFDGFEMGLFPVVSGPALSELIETWSGEKVILNDPRFLFWSSVITSGFLVGAAAGGVLFGWLGDRLGRVRAMTLSILTYALCSGLGGVAMAPWQMVVIRFIAALGMGGEWSLGVALVMEVWGGRSRAMLAGLIGAAANVGYLLVALLSLGLGSVRSFLSGMGLSESWMEWRLLMVCGALPALLTFFVRLFVPESHSWQREQQKGKTSSWAGRDLLAVLAGVGVCCALLAIWQWVEWWSLRIGALVIALITVAGCFLFPVVRYLGRANEPVEVRNDILRRMVLAAVISGVPLLATWGAVQQASGWAHFLGNQAVAELKNSGAGANEVAARQDEVRHWKEYTQILGAVGAVIGCIAGALLASWAGRRLAYICLCLTSLAAVLAFYQLNETFNTRFMLTAFLSGGFSAAFYGWLPLYLPELFPTRVRATGQGFGFNFGRIIAAIGVLQLPVLMGKPPDYATACSSLAFIYLAGLVVIWLVPETRGKPLPE